MYRKILVGYDGSASSRKAFETALELAKKDGAELFVQLGPRSVRPHFSRKSFE